MSETQEEMSVDEVKVIVIVPPSREPEDVWDVEGRPCPICLKDLDNGNKIMVMSCSGNHFLCKDCHEGYGHHDRQMIADTYAATLFEAINHDCVVTRTRSRVIGLSPSFNSAMGHLTTDIRCNDDLL